MAGAPDGAIGIRIEAKQSDGEIFATIQPKVFGDGAFHAGGVWPPVNRSYACWRRGFDDFHPQVIFTGANLYG